MSVYLDTQVVTWLSASRFKKLPAAASRAVDSSNVIISPMVLLELEYLHEIGRTARPAMAVLEQLEKQLGLTVSESPFLTVAQAALHETWTRDPFDRIIVAHARSDGYSKLVSSDTNIKRNYSMTIWD